MAKYLHRFTTGAEFNAAYYGDEYKKPWVSYTNETRDVEYNKSKRQELLETPLTFEILSDGNIAWRTNDTAHTVTLEYKKNDNEWVEITSTTGDGATISVVSGDTVQFRGDNTTISYSATQICIINEFYGTTCEFNAKGNIMSILEKDNFRDMDILPEKYVFYNLFRNCTGLTDASELVLPATTLTESCYSNLFNGCIGLTAAPELPATTLNLKCYISMFSGCTSLVNAPELPATTLANNCYYYMFNGCTGLTQAPKLPATTLSDKCYYAMFNNCTSLTTAPSILPATTLASSCYTCMFSGCTSLTEAPELPATTLAYGSCHGMFASCTSLTKAPSVLPATTLVESCYQSMFQGCTSLTTAPALPATTLTYGCYRYMFRGCTSLTTAPELPATTLAESCYYWMFFGCTSLNYIKCLATDISANACTTNWVQGVASTGTFIKDSNMPVGTGGWTTGDNGIPSNWTVQDA